VNSVAIATVILAIVGVFGIGTASVGWFYRRGGDERAFAVALQENTEALKELSGEFRRFRDEVIDKLHGLDLRVTRLEITPPPVQVTTKIEATSDASAPAYRNAGTPG
jgi:hypothetical protein